MEESDGLEPPRAGVHQAGGICADGLPGVSGQAGDGRAIPESVAVDRARGGRHFVKKAVNWALRNIGKRNLRLNREATRAAARIRRQGSRSARWIAADALRELEGPAVEARLRRKASSGS